MVENWLIKSLQKKSNLAFWNNNRKINGSILKDFAARTTMGGEFEEVLANIKRFCLGTEMLIIGKQTIVFFHQ